MYLMKSVLNLQTKSAAARLPRMIMRYCENILFAASAGVKPSAAGGPPLLPLCPPPCCCCGPAVPFPPSLEDIVISRCCNDAVESIYLAVPAVVVGKFWMPVLFDFNFQVMRCVVGRWLNR